MTMNSRSTQSITGQSVSEDQPKLLWFLPYLFPLGLVLFILILYANTLGGDFLNMWGDNRYITQNALVQDQQLGKIWTSFYQGEYIPLTFTSFTLDQLIWGSNPLGYRLVNLLLHMGNVLLVYFALQIITKRDSVAIIGAALFAVHPLQTEAVAWVSQRKTLLATFFFLLALYFHLLHTQKRSRTWAIVGAWVSYALSILSSPLAVLAPIVFISIDWLWLRRSITAIIPRNLGYILMGIGGVIATLLAQNDNGGFAPRATASPLEATELFLWSVWDYILSIVLPFNLNNLYVYDINRLSLIFPPVWLGLLMIIASILIAIFQPFGKPFPRWAMIWFWAFLLPVLNIIPTSFVRSDYRLYLPSIMLYGLIAYSVTRIWEMSRRDEVRYALIGVSGALITLFAVLTFFRNENWANETKLWDSHLSHYSDENEISPTGLLNAAQTAYNTSDFQQAAIYLDELLVTIPNYAQANALRGSISLLEGNYIEAAQYYAVAVNNAPNNVEYRASLGISLFQAGVQAFNLEDYQTAFNLYIQALDFIPNEPILHNNIGYTLFTTGSYNEAILAYNRALELDPNYTRAWINLGDAALNISRFELARTAYNNALNLGGTLNALSASNLCLALGELLEEPQRAVSFCQQAYDAEPNNGLYLGRAAHVLLLFGQPENALPVAIRAVEVQPDLALNQRVLGDAYALTGNPDAARIAYQNALQLQPNNQKALAGIAALDAGQLPNPVPDSQ